MKYWIHLKLLISNVPSAALARHQVIYQAIRDREVELASKYMKQHLDETSALVAQVAEGRYGKDPLVDQPAPDHSADERS